MGIRTYNGQAGFPQTRQEGNNMTTRPNDPFGDTVRALFRPEPPTPSATPRVAVLNPGDGTLSQLLKDCGLVVVHERTTKQMKIDLDKLPVYDLVAANIPEDPKEQENVLELTARFLYRRRPLSFLFVAERMGPDFLKATDKKLWRMGYQFSIGDAQPGAWGRKNCAYLIGTLDGLPSIWPQKITASSGGPDEGLDESLDKYQNILGWQKVNEPPVVTLEEIIKTVANHGRGDDDYFDEDHADG